MRALLSKAEIQSEITDRFGTAGNVHQKAPTEILSTGVPEVDALTSGLPRGAITEVFGTNSSGRTSFILSALAHATNVQEVCALVDTNDAFDPVSAAGASMIFDQLLWVRCASEGTLNVPEGKRIERAFKAADLLLQSGGFGLVALDLADIAPQEVRRIISSWWFRFRRAIENTPTVLMVTAQASCVGSRAALALEVSKEKVAWTSVDEANRDYAGATGNSVIPLNSNSERRAPEYCLRSTPHPSLLIPARLRHELLLQGLHLTVERQKPISFGLRKASLLTSARL
jgi:hypothetical protein